MARPHGGRTGWPLAEALWRIPLVLFTAMSGMAFGSWFAGRIYDYLNYYAPAFGSGVVFNLVNLALVGFLVIRLSGWTRIGVYIVPKDAAPQKAGVVRKVHETCADGCILMKLQPTRSRVVAGGVLRRRSLVS
jgi:hypothetical protein